MMKFRITLADNWRTLHRRGTVIVSGALAIVTAAGPAIVDAWNTMPADLKGLLPQGVQRYAAIIAFALILVVRYTAVRRVPPPDAGAGQGDGDGGR
ncbi:hypothetical protein [Burkholderia multivorans]|uniref:DUF7940 domain-containing protein n=1 Tax=Burkholderia multivorans TaxID=87883 RepID=UPI001FC89D0E|nr:hypothetical protein [Burkholderia multivorans]MCA8339610.1 hypothetical protein [Burkholderia multivorans]